MNKCILDQTWTDLKQKAAVGKSGLGQKTLLVRHSNKRHQGRKVVVLKKHNDGTYNVRVMGTTTFLMVNRWQLGRLG